MLYIKTTHPVSWNLSVFNFLLLIFDFETYHENPLIMKTCLPVGGSWFRRHIQKITQPAVSLPNCDKSETFLRHFNALKH